MIKLQLIQNLVWTKQKFKMNGDKDKNVDIETGTKTYYTIKQISSIS